jgi:hypothetical protein
MTGSGIETAAHVLESPRMTMMFCSFARAPLILRVYGQAKMIRPKDSDWIELSALFPIKRESRQTFDLKIELVQTSCGYAVPHYEFLGERDTLHNWADNESDSE